ncbi:hypothetical protein O6H91_08G098900 [Diphasiastrum complanatum]|uniref:Uncharacterized protein n=3 Tax=Diphasiastrum complanatum TaxID=34168 RepID=A0ACC2D0H4_DIPCM|nr:hypothetical protein O6H91_08G098900 [Diphasiastrum complanatum]KAJ7547689.1 hypothetical protein O6H91_08G098900 [Diphasiastrum complanatum]KAJ7547690.1 hypothetical protein O6H91_08G098900 [Diphasiastrum complanatum]
MSASPTVVWLRRDLRVEDNPALVAAARAGPVVPVYIWCPNEEGQFHPGRVSRWWLKQSLIHLGSSLRSLGSSLILRKANDTLEVLQEIVQATGAKSVFYNHLYDPVSLVRDHRVKQGLYQHGISVRTFNGDLLYEPWEICNDAQQTFTSFEDYWSKCMSMPFEPEAPLLPPRRLISVSSETPTLSIEELGLEDTLEKSSNALLARAWTPGWSHADQALERFLSGPLAEYAASREKADSTTTSMLSPHLHFGELSVRKIFHGVRMKQVLWVKEDKVLANQSANLFLRAIGLREYSRYLCFNFPFTHERSLLANLKSFPWRIDEGYFKAWRQGRTGYPLVDAGMRELWATGWLHDRIRVVVSSFCVKFLQLPWRWGMKYFWDTLLDADLESDILGWQYISGSLPDGYELDRMENPQIEGYKLDPEGEYVRKWLPELSRLPTDWIHHPWDAPPSVLLAAGVELGCNYPRPIVEIAAARERLQQALAEMWRREEALKTSTENGLQEDSCDNINVPSMNHRLFQNVHEGPNDERNREISSGSSRRDQLVPIICRNSPVQPMATDLVSTAAAAEQEQGPPLLSSQGPEHSPSHLPEVSRQDIAPPPLAQVDNSTAESSSSNPLGANDKNHAGTAPIWSQQVLQSQQEEARLSFLTDINCGVSYRRQLQSSRTVHSSMSIHKGEKKGSESGRHKYLRPTKRQAVVDN